MPRNKPFNPRVLEEKYNALKTQSDANDKHFRARLREADKRRDDAIRTTRQDADERIRGARRTADQEAAARRTAEHEAAKSSTYANKLSQRLAKQLEEKNRPKAAARTIQKAWGQSADRFREKGRNNAATQIQALGRGHILRSAIRDSILHNGAAAEIQDAWK
ncbi:MAG: hypothetical protein MK137_07445, partial [Rickettsiales bacterium]|nr:hypothetical protein [Rickettsiales bacterium]